MRLWRNCWYVLSFLLQLRAHIAPRDATKEGMMQATSDEGTVTLLSTEEMDDFNDIDLELDA